MRLTVVGCTGSMSGPYAPASCYLVQARGIDPNTEIERVYSVVLDLGPGSFGMLWRYLDVRHIDAVLLSHTHADHMGDVISLHVHRRWHPSGTLSAIMLGGPPGVMERVRGIDGAGPEETYGDVFTPYEFEDGKPLRIGPLHITPYAGRHTVPSFGFRIAGPSEGDPLRTVELAYTGDTDSCPRITQMARRVELLLSEAGFTRADKPRGVHLTGERAGQLAKEAEVGSLVLTHIQPWTDPQVVVGEAREVWDGAISTAYAGATYSL